MNTNTILLLWEERGCVKEQDIWRKTGDLTGVFVGIDLTWKSNECLIYSLILRNVNNKNHWNSRDNRTIGWFLLIWLFLHSFREQIYYFINILTLDHGNPKFFKYSQILIKIKRQDSVSLASRATFHWYNEYTIQKWTIILLQRLISSIYLF